jgi:hypothetical protein
MGCGAGCWTNNKIGQSAESFEAFSIDKDDEGKINIENKCDGCGKEFLFTQNPNLIGGNRAGAIVYEMLNGGEIGYPEYSPHGDLLCKSCYGEEAEEEYFHRYNRGQGQLTYEAEGERTFTVSKGPKRMYIVVEYNDGKELFLDGDGQKQFMEELIEAEATGDKKLIESLFGVGSDYHNIAEDDFDMGGPNSTPFEATRGIDTYAQPFEDMKIGSTTKKVATLIAAMIGGGAIYSHFTKRGE